MGPGIYLTQKLRLGSDKVSPVIAVIKLFYLPIHSLRTKSCRLIKNAHDDYVILRHVQPPLIGSRIGLSSAWNRVVGEYGIGHAEHDFFRISLRTDLLVSD